MLVDIGSTAMSEINAPALSVTVSVGSINKNTTEPTQCYAMYKLSNDLNEYINATPSSASINNNRGQYIFNSNGDGTDVWVERTINSGSLDQSDPGSGRLVLSTPRIYGMTATAVGIETTEVQFDFYDASSDGNLLRTNTITFLCQVFSNQ